MGGWGEESMALNTSQWQKWRAHIDHVVSSQGQWVGLLNGDYEPVADFPALIDLVGGGNMSGESELSLTVPALTSRGEAVSVLDLLVDEGMGNIDSSSRLEPSMKKSWFICIQRAGGEAGRKIYKVIFPTVTFMRSRPFQLRANAVSVDSLLGLWPCPSVPAIWGNEPIIDWHEDAAGPYKKPYRYAPIEMAEVARGYIRKGPAEETIQHIIQTSLDAGNRVHPEWTEPHLVVDFSSTGFESPEVLIRLDDRTITETISDPARLAGVNISVGLWWPGDVPFPAKFEVSSQLFDGVWDESHPVLVARVRQMEGKGI